jgi:hypothetical protein
LLDFKVGDYVSIAVSIVPPYSQHLNLIARIMAVENDRIYVSYLDFEGSDTHHSRWYNFSYEQIERRFILMTEEELILNRLSNIGDVCVRL